MGADFRHDAWRFDRLEADFRTLQSEMNSRFDLLQYTLFRVTAFLILVLATVFVVLQVELF